MLPSLRRPEQSLITIPLPLIRVRHRLPSTGGSKDIIRQTIQLPCDLAIIMCDPEWKVKLGAEIIIFIHRPGEDLSDLLYRWRTTQIHLDKEYEWLMPPKDEHMFSEGADQVHPLFVLFENSPTRIRKGLAGSYLPNVVDTHFEVFSDEELLKKII
ncbi:MAG: hypothetical protein N5P05_002914 [Chroococcopsis gigantea SAG 12.99]|jgi:hypothetical protein|nr:hypothetical protein [Chroococcopsis gigantea SAG 12.99]